MYRQQTSDVGVGPRAYPDNGQPQGVAPTKEISNKTKALVHIAKAELGLADTIYRDILHVRYHAESCKKLTPFQADDLMKYFRSLGFRKKRTKCNLCTPRVKRPKPPENVFYLVSEEQLAKIQHLKEDIKWRHPDGFNLWMRKYFKIERIRLSIEGSVIIEALKHMVCDQNRRDAKKCGTMNS